MDYAEVMAALDAKVSLANAEGMARYGINTSSALGVSMQDLRPLARRVGRDHALARELWGSGIHEARILACLIDDPKLVDEAQAEQWVSDFDSWDLCDQCCGNLFDRAPFAYAKAAEWCGRGETFVKRAGFALIAYLALHDKRAANQPFLEFLTLIERECEDDRNFVKKAVNWSLRQIGKRNKALWAESILTAERMANRTSAAARWVARDALHELNSAAVRRRLGVDGSS